ncbi:hypothetical protein SRABI106_04581 [Rahnella aquatilis]|nr:hypothetical protein SRABI106_04581 [Rahnella aquatilis]
MQRDGFFRLLTFALRRGHDQQQLFLTNLFEFIVTGIHQIDVNFRGDQVITQLLGNTAGVTRLRGGNQSD